MCFSASASLTAAVVLVLLGLYTTYQVIIAKHLTYSKYQKVSLLLVAATPLCFGLHQLSEGMVWLDSDNQVAICTFAYTAYVYWPFYIALASCCAEWTRRPNDDDMDRSNQPSSSERNRVQGNVENTSLDYYSFFKNRRALSLPMRKKLLVVNTVLGFLLMVSTVWQIRQTKTPIEVKTENGRLEYSGWTSGSAFDLIGVLAYVYIVIGSIMMSSLKHSRLFGFAVLFAFCLSSLLWLEQMPSTWCFFAAILSCLVLWVVQSELETQKGTVQNEGNHSSQNELNTLSMATTKNKVSQSAAMEDASDNI